MKDSKFADLYQNFNTIILVLEVTGWNAIACKSLLWNAKNMLIIHLLKDCLQKSLLKKNFMKDTCIPDWQEYTGPETMKIFMLWEGWLNRIKRTHTFLRSGFYFTYLTTYDADDWLIFSCSSALI